MVDMLCYKPYLHWFYAINWQTNEYENNRLIIITCFAVSSLDDVIY